MHLQVGSSVFVFVGLCETQHKYQPAVIGVLQNKLLGLSDL